VKPRSFKVPLAETLRIEVVVLGVVPVNRVLAGKDSETVTVDEIIN
jgi:hypothetical protein